jgi:hypothetical protein
MESYSTKVLMSVPGAYVGNEYRPHQGIGGKTPKDIVDNLSTKCLTHTPGTYLI